MQWDDERMDRTIGGMLRAGVLAAVSVVLGGGIWYLMRYRGTIPDYHSFHGEPHELRTVAGVIAGTLGGDPRSLIQLGMLLLIATPVARVAFSVFAFAARRDRLYAGITLLVLAVLLVSLSGVGYPAP